MTLNAEQPVADCRVVLLHGFAADSQSWMANSAALFDLGRVQTVDLPAHGTAWKSPPATSLAGISEQVAAVLADESTPVHLVGHSMGAAVALLLASAEVEGRSVFPVASVSLLAPLGLGSSINRDFINGVSDLSGRDAAMNHLQELVFNPKMIGSQQADMLLQQIQRPGVATHLQRLAAMLSDVELDLELAVDRVARSGVPRSIFWGRNDRINVPDASMETRFGGQWHWFDDCGHLPQVEKRTRFNALITEFIGTNA